ncbi:MAG: homoserine dehydrogenase [Erysipelotrichales bacterium]|nr:homoserine dehydrogenase [Erysipelotrichales bacterium]
MNIAILGYGTVGTGVDKILKNNKRIFVTRILEKASRIDGDKRKTSSIEDIIDDTSIDGVVETMGGIDTAYDYISRAMRAGKFVVTANKAVVAAYYKELHELAKECNVKFAYEASVGGVLPIIHMIHSINRYEDILEVGGILNGTSNYILDTMTKDKLPFTVALRQAQEAGYAESDPSADIDGIDVKNKLMILSSLAFKQVSEYDKIKVTGIRNITKEDIDYFTKQGAVCRLFALAKRNDDTYTSVIEPVLFDGNSVFANVSLNNNAAFVYSRSSGQIVVHGQGAGQLPTGHAVVQDIVDIYEGVSKEFENLSKYTYIDEDKETMYYVRTNADMNKYIEYTECIGELAYYVKVDTRSKWDNILTDILSQDSRTFYARYDEECWKAIKSSGVKVND